MSKTCFVIMGYGMKQGIDLDLTYTQIIKPCILENGLRPVELFANSKDNAFRCDEISGGGLIDYKFVVCLDKADIVIADISTMNNNAIYELGARHALKPRSTILMCAKGKKDEFKFFDLNYVPIIFYEHKKTKISPKIISETKKQLNQSIASCIVCEALEPDNPIQRALTEHTLYTPCGSDEKKDIYGLYQRAKEKLDDNYFEDAYKLFNELYAQNPDEETLLALTLAKYKLAEQQNDCRGLFDCLDLIYKHIDIESSTSESLFGRIAAISLRLFDMLKDSQHYHKALEYYRRGSSYSKGTLYCPRNYCALLMRTYEITDDVNVIRECYYTSKHYAKIFYNQSTPLVKLGDFEQSIYYSFNLSDLKLIIDSDYAEHNRILDTVTLYKGISKRQTETISKGVKKLHSDVEETEKILNLI